MKTFFYWFILLTALVLQPVDAYGFIGRLFDKSGSGSDQESSAPSAVMVVGNFTGGTGTSARGALILELEKTRAFHVLREDDQTESTTPGARFVVAGHSVGGRVTGKLKNEAGKLLFERTYAAPGLDENLKALVDDLIYTVTGRPGLATSRIVFVSDRSGTKQIYVCDAEGDNVQQVTRHRHGCVSPSISPDASLLAFTSYRNGFPTVMLMDLGGGMERTITDTPGTNFGAAFAPDGRHLALVMSFLGNPEIFVTDLRTNTAACVTESIGIPCSPAWSPSGERLVFSSDEGGGQQLFIADFGSGKSAGGVERFHSGFSFTTDPEWSPDGENLAFSARSRGGWLVAVKPLSSGRAKVIQRGCRHPSWSPDGKFLIYTMNGELIRHDLSGDRKRVLVGGYGEISEPRWMK